MIRFVLVLALALPVLAGPACAAAIKAPTVGCTTPATAQKIALAQQRDRKGADALTRPLVASRECIDFARGVKIEVEEHRAPMACVRLAGDLSCFWIAAAYINENPDDRQDGKEGGRGGGGKHGGGGMNGGTGGGGMSGGGGFSRSYNGSSSGPGND